MLKRNEENILSMLERADNARWLDSAVATIARYPEVFEEIISPCPSPLAQVARCMDQRPQYFVHELKGCGILPPDRMDELHAIMQDLTQNQLLSLQALVDDSALEKEIRAEIRKRTKDRKILQRIETSPEELSSETARYFELGRDWPMDGQDIRDALEELQQEHTDEGSGLPDAWVEKNFPGFASVLKNMDLFEKGGN